MPNVENYYCAKYNIQFVYMCYASPLMRKTLHIKRLIYLNIFLIFFFFNCALHFFRIFDKSWLIAENPDVSTEFTHFLKTRRVVFGLFTMFFVP